MNTLYPVRNMHSMRYPLQSRHMSASEITGNSIVCSTFCALLVQCEGNPPTFSIRWRHNGRDGVSNQQPHDCVLNSLFGRRSKKTSKFRVTDLCVGNSPVPVNSPHKWPVTRKMFPFDDVIMFPHKESVLWKALLLSWRRHEYALRETSYCHTGGTH